MGSGAGHDRAATGRQRPAGRRTRVLVPAGGKSSQAVSSVPEAPAHRRRWPIHAVPGVPVRPTRKSERQQEGHRRVARPQIAQVPTPGILARPGPAVGIDRVPRREQVAHLEVKMRARGISRATAERDQLASRHVLSRIHEELIVVEVGGAVVGVIDDDAPTAAVAPLAVDDGALIGRQHRRVRRYGEIRTPMAVIGVAPGAVEADHRPVVLPVGVMVVRPRGYAWMRVGKRQGQVPGCRRGLRGEQGQGNGKSYRPVQP